MYDRLDLSGNRGGNFSPKEKQANRKPRGVYQSTLCGGPETQGLLSNLRAFATAHFAAISIIAN